MGTMQAHFDEWAGAACRNPSPQDFMRYGWDLMYPKDIGRGKRTRQENHVIKTYCRTCPLQQYCKEQGKDQEYGIWGGESEDTRRTNREWVRFFAA